MKQLTIVIPCYNEQEVIQESFDRLSELSANVGHQQALMAGLEHAVADSDIVLSIDADLQDDINVVPQMIDSCEAGCDIVYGVRRYRQSDTLFKRSTAQLFYRMMGRMGVKTVYNHADFRLMSRRAVEHLCQYRERNLFLRGIVPLLGFPTATVCYDRSPRTAGTTKYSLTNLIGHDLRNRDFGDFITQDNIARRTSYAYEYLISQVDAPRMVNMNDGAGLGIMSEALPACKHWSLQWGATPQMKQDIMDACRSGKADFAVVNRISTAERKQLKAWGWHEYDYSSDIYDNVLLSKRKLRLLPKKFPGMADAARKRSIE